MCGRRTGGRLGAAPRRPGKRPERAAGAPGPRAPLVFRVSLSTKLAADAGARLHLDFLCDSGAGHEGCGEETARHVWVTGGCLAFPSNKPGDVCTKNMPRAAVCCPLRGKSFAHRHASAHSSVSPRMCPAASCRGCFPKGAWPAKKVAPCKIWGFSPHILSLPVVGTRGRGINTSTVGQTRSIQQKLARPQPGGRIRRTYRSRASELL